MKNSKYQIKFINTFKKQYTKIKNTPNFKQEEFNKVIEILSNNEILPAKYKNHLLTPKANGIWECHIQNDILLEYQKFDDKLILLLIGIGTHSQLFK